MTIKRNEEETTKQEAKHRMRFVWESYLQTTKHTADQQRKILQSFLSQQSISPESIAREEILFSKRVKESIVEGRSNNDEEEGKLHWSEICAVSAITLGYGKEGWLCYGTQADNEFLHWKDSFKEGSSSSYRPQSIEQLHQQLNVISNEWRSQKMGTRQSISSNLICGNNVEVMRTFPANSIDSIVADGPYGLSFMGRKWDYQVPSVETWEEALRVVKPGGHLLNFAGPRTYHRMAVNVEDAGWEIRDQIQWIMGSGFPKSHNIGKAYDKKMGNEREAIEPVGRYKSSFKDNAGKLVNTRDASEDKINITQSKGTSPYEGWGTALKPANEPIVLARKPLSEKTIVDNVIKWGTGGINIDGCRVSNETGERFGGGAKATSIFGKGDSPYEKDGFKASNTGRFPANVIHDGSDEVLEGFPHTKATGTGKHYDRAETDANHTLKFTGKKHAASGHNDSGSAARFFYCAKVSKKERNVGDTTNGHPTVKPVDLMSYLVRLITPQGGIVLDPFNGSGSTGMAAKQEGCSYVGIDLNQEYLDISKARIDAWESVLVKTTTTESKQLSITDPMTGLAY